MPRKMTPDTRDTLIFDHSADEGKKMLAQVDVAESENLYNYCLVAKNFCDYIQDGQISGSIAQGVGKKEIDAFIRGIEAAHGPVRKFRVN